MADVKPIVIINGNLSEIPLSDTLVVGNVNITDSMIIPDKGTQSGIGNIAYDAIAETINIDFGSGFSVVGTTGALFFGKPVADFSSLPSTDPIGTLRVTLDNFAAYIWNGSSWTSADNYLHKPAIESDITGLVVSGSMVGELIVSSDTFRLYIWDGSSWELTSSTFLVKDESGVEISGLFDIVSVNNTLTADYVNGTGLLFDLSAAGVSVIHSVSVGVYLSSGYDQNIYSISAVPVINGSAVNIKITIGYDDVSQGLLINEELDILSGYPFDGSFIDQVVIRALVK